jgi:hypothetical protein
MSGIHQKGRLRISKHHIQSSDHSQTLRYKQLYGRLPVEFGEKGTTDCIIMRQRQRKERIVKVEVVLNRPHGIERQVKNWLDLNLSRYKAERRVTAASSSGSSW